MSERNTIDIGMTWNVDQPTALWIPPLDCDVALSEITQCTMDALAEVDMCWNHQFNLKPFETFVDST